MSHDPQCCFSESASDFPQFTSGHETQFVKEILWLAIMLGYVVCSTHKKNLSLNHPVDFSKALTVCLSVLSM